MTTDPTKDFIGNGGKIAIVAFLIIGVISATNFTLKATFQEHTVLNRSYNPAAEPEYAEICDSTYGTGESCGETLLNASDYQREITYRTFFLDGFSQTMFGHNWWTEDDMTNPQLIYLGLYSAAAWIGWKRITKKDRPEDQVV
jgi:hypothetical protein